MTRGTQSAPARPGLATRMLRGIEAWRRRPLALRAAVATALLVVALLARLAIFGMTSGAVLPFLVPAVLLGSLLCRALTGIAMAIVAWAASVYFFIEPIGRFAIGNVEDAIIAVLLLVAAIGASLVIEILWLLAEDDEDGVA